MSDQGRWYFTSPWESVPVRRGDALGFRGGADYFAELLAPGLSNNTSDARWISILSWCLDWSHVVWKNAGGRELATRDGQRERYAWLRPLELLWIDRTLESGRDTGQLRGRRSITRWRKAGRPTSKDDGEFRFEMSPDQFRRYRQVGSYGAYRVIFRRIPGFTTGDGWTPQRTALELSQIVNASLPRSARLEHRRFEVRTQWGRWRDGDEARYWAEHGWWAANTKTTQGVFPTADGEFWKRLPTRERELLEPILFAEKSRRRATAEALASAKGVLTHAHLCEVLASSRALTKDLGSASLAPLPAFTRFADAAMVAMSSLWTAINGDAENQKPEIDKLLKSSALRERLASARERGVEWLHAPGRSAFPHEATVTRLATAMQKAKTSSDQLRALAKHHHEFGGGRRWFREQSGKMLPLIAASEIPVSDYRFRLRAISRLAAQCGVAKMNVVLDAIERSEVEEHEEGDES